MFAMHEHAPVPHVGRETMIRHLDGWARTHGDEVHVVFDGSKPPTDLARQLCTSRVEVTFSEGETADDVIIRRVRRARFPADMTIVSSDRVIQYDARYRKCDVLDCPTFIRKMFPTNRADGKRHRDDTDPRPSAKPDSPKGAEVDEWIEIFGVDDDDTDSTGFDEMLK
jgi:predicted RNA-binding protein with PIN domain